MLYYPNKLTINFIDNNINNDIIVVGSIKNYFNIS